MLYMRSEATKSISDYSNRNPHKMTWIGLKETSQKTSIAPRISSDIGIRQNIKFSPAAALSVKFFSPSGFSPDYASDLGQILPRIRIRYPRSPSQMIRIASALLSICQKNTQLRPLTLMQGIRGVLSVRCGQGRGHPPD